MCASKFVYVCDIATEMYGNDEKRLVKQPLNSSSRFGINCGMIHGCDVMKVCV